MISQNERLFWYSQLVMHGHSSEEAARVIDREIERLCKENEPK